MAKKAVTKQQLTVDTTVNSQANREVLLTMFPKLREMVKKIEEAGGKVSLKIERVEIEIEGK